MLPRMVFKGMRLMTCSNARVRKASGQTRGAAGITGPPQVIELWDLIGDEIAADRANSPQDGPGDHLLQHGDSTSFLRILGKNPGGTKNPRRGGVGGLRLTSVRKHGSGTPCRSHKRKGTGVAVQSRFNPGSLIRKTGGSLGGFQQGQELRFNLVVLNIIYQGKFFNQ